MGKLSPIVFSIAFPMGCLSLFLAKKRLAHPLVIAGLAQGSIVGHVVAIACMDRFAQATTSLLGKRKSDGFFRWWSIPVWWPYFIGLQLKLRVQRLFSTEPLWTEVLPGFYIGGWPESADALPQKRSLGDLAVIDATCELFRSHASSPYLNLPTWDTAGVSVAHLEEGVRWAADQIAKGRDMYVHCAHGHGRSAAVLCCILIDQGIVRTAEEGEALMKKYRPLVRLNKTQKASVNAWIEHRRMLGDRPGATPTKIVIKQLDSQSSIGGPETPAGGAPPSVTRGKAAAKTPHGHALAKQLTNTATGSTGSLNNAEL